MMDGNIEILDTVHGNQSLPSCVAFTDHEILVGDDAMDYLTISPENTKYGRPIDMLSFKLTGNW